MSNWTLIAVAAALSYTLRFLPVLIFRRFKINGQGDFYQYLSYAACAVMGALFIQSPLAMSILIIGQGTLKVISSSS